MHPSPSPSRAREHQTSSASSVATPEFKCHHADCLRVFARKTSLTNHLKAHLNPRSRSIYRNKRARARAAANAVAVAAAAAVNMGQSPTASGVSVPSGKRHLPPPFPLGVSPTHIATPTHPLGLSPQHQAQLQASQEALMFGGQPQSQMLMHHAQVRGQAATPAHQQLQQNQLLQLQQQKQQQQQQQLLYEHLSTMSQSSVYQLQQLSQQLSFQQQLQQSQAQPQAQPQPQHHLSTMPHNNHFQQAALACYRPVFSHEHSSYHALHDNASTVISTSTDPETQNYTHLQTTHLAGYRSTQATTDLNLIPHSPDPDPDPDPDPAPTSAPTPTSAYQFNLTPDPDPDPAPMSTPTSMYQFKPAPDPDPDPEPDPAPTSTPIPTSVYQFKPASAPAPAAVPPPPPAPAPTETLPFGRAMPEPASALDPAPALSSTPQMVTQSSSFPATFDLDLGTAPSLSRFLSGSGHEDRPSLATRMASSDSIEQTLAMSMTAPLPALSPGKLFSCSSVGAGPQNKEDVANVVDDVSLKTMQGDTDALQALTDRATTTTSGSTTTNNTQNGDGSRNLAALDELGNGHDPVMPIGAGSEAVEAAQYREPEWALEMVKDLERSAGVPYE